MQQMVHLYSVSSHTRRSISGVISATAAIIRNRSSASFADRGGTYTRSLTKLHRKKIQRSKIGGTRWPRYRRRSANPPTWETGVGALADVSMVITGCALLLEVHASYVVIFAKLWKEELFEDVQFVKRLLKHPVFSEDSRVVEYYGPSTGK
jgi:hypothetical protein